MADSDISKPIPVEQPEASKPPVEISEAHKEIHQTQDSMKSVDPVIARSMQRMAESDAAGQKAKDKLDQNLPTDEQKLAYYKALQANYADHRSKV